MKRPAVLLAFAVAVAQDRPDSRSLVEQLHSLNRNLSELSVLEQRSNLLAQLIATDPKTAIDEALPAERAAELVTAWPQAASLIESRGEWQGSAVVIAEDDFEKGVSRTRVWIETDSGKLEVHFAESPPPVISGQILKVRGIRLAKHLAATLTDAGPPPPGAPACGAIGDQKFAVLILEFPGVALDPAIATADKLREMYFSKAAVSVDGYWREASYGLASASGDVFGPIKLDKNYDFSTQLAEAFDAAIHAADLTIDFTVYNHVVLIWPSPGVSGWGGRGTVGCVTLNSPSKGPFQGTQTWMAAGTAQPYDALVGVVAHEAGHNLGLNHSSSRDFSPDTLAPPGVLGTLTEYGDRFDLMGGGYFGSRAMLGHHNAPHKTKLGWLQPGSDVQDVESDGAFTLQPFESSKAGLKAIRVRRGPGSDKWLWLEYRQPIGYDESFTGSGTQQYSGALIHYEDPALTTLPFYSFLLDFTPATAHNFSDPALAAGQVWSDLYSPLSIAAESASASGLGVRVSFRTACVTLPSTNHQHGPQAETGTIAVSAPSGCSWTATSSAVWITVANGQSGIGAGTVSYSVAANNSLTARTGTIIVGWQTFTVSQSTAFVNQTPTTDSVNPKSGTGLSQVFTFSASDPNGAADLRNLDPYFADPVTACVISYQIAANQIYLSGEKPGTAFSGPVTPGTNVALQNSFCGLDASGISATSSDNTMTLTLPMVFTGKRNWTIGANVYDKSVATTLKLLGSWTVPDSACSYSPAPTSIQVSKNATIGTIAVEAPPDCPWLASSTPAWITITSGVRGAGGGTVVYSISANPNPAPRNGIITIGGQQVAVTQSATAGTRPLIASGGVVNGASFLAGTAPSTWITIRGTNLSATTRTWASADFVGDRLPTQLDNVSVSINNKPAFVYYVSPIQINVLSPDDDRVGPVTVLVATPQGVSDPFTANQQSLSPAFFLFDGGKYIAAVHSDGTFLGKPNLIPAITTRPAKPGETILLFGTGFGSTDPTRPAAELVGQAAPLSTAVTVRIGNAIANVAFAGLVSSGLDQFNVTVPDVPDGDQPVVIEIGGVQSQPNAFVTVQR